MIILMRLVLATAVFQSMAPQSASDIANQFNSYLMLGYFVMWFVVMIYIITLVVRQRNLRKDLQLMQQILQENEDQVDS
jgi:heme/copper-type cytochrome/quinol oxidase subunit 2